VDASSLDKIKPDASGSYYLNSEVSNECNSGCLFISGKETSISRLHLHLELEGNGVSTVVNVY
jgi:hypothetical protein